MLLIIGLGNPGQKFQKTRHNLGWLVLDLLQKRLREEYSFSTWKKSNKFKAEVSKGKIKNKKIVLAKPLTFMNLSGQAVKSLASFYKIKPKNLFVVHDDVDIPLGKIRIVKNRGTAGHKGIQSIIRELGTKNFARLRIGIKSGNSKPKNVEKFVLLKINGNNKKNIEEAIGKTTEAIEKIIKEGLEKTMNKFN